MDCFVLDICLLVLELPFCSKCLKFKLHQCHQCGCCQPFFCCSSSCNKQDTLLGQCSQEGDSYALVPEESIRGTMAQALSTVYDQEAQVMLKNGGSTQCDWNSELTFKQYPHSHPQPPGVNHLRALAWCGEQGQENLSAVFFFTVKGREDEFTRQGSIKEETWKA